MFSEAAAAVVVIPDDRASPFVFNKDLPAIGVDALFECGVWSAEFAAVPPGQCGEAVPRRAALIPISGAGSMPATTLLFLTEA